MIYIADERLVVEMPFEGKGLPKTNSEGWLRNSDHYWEEMYNRHPEAFSQFNKDIIFGKNPDGLKAPVNDKTFRKVFPQYDKVGLKGKKLVHHHIGGGGQAFGLPQPLHPGCGGIHNVEKEFGIWDADSNNAELLKKFL